MSFQQWSSTDEPIRPGLYINFVKAAVAQITGGSQGTVAIPLKEYENPSQAGKFYTIENEADAIETFGSKNIQSILFALAGGAKEVLVYTMPTIEEGEEKEAYTAARNEFEARKFNVFVYDGEVSQDVQADTVSWVDRNREEKKHFTFVVGGTAEEDADIEEGNDRSVLLADDYVVNLVSGVIMGDKEYSSGEYASYVAGLVAGTPINKSITYTQIRVDDVTKRLRNSEIVKALEAGSLVLVHDGEKVVVEQGLVSSSDKLRKVRARQAVSTDIEKAARDNYIGKLDNNEAGQMTLISAITSYLETLENENVLEDIEVGLSDKYESAGDKVYVDIAYTEIDSMERVFLTVNI